MPLLAAPLLLALLPAAPPTRPFATLAAPRASALPMMQLFGGPKLDAREADFQRRQEKLASRKAANAQPKGQVTVTFPQKGNKQVTAQQGEPIGAVCNRAGVRVKFDCKTGRCATCQVRLNGRSAVKVCQGATVPGGATKKLTITLDNP